MSFDVESLHGRRNDDRWNRMAVGDILERLTWSEPNKIAIVADPEAVADARYERVTYREANELANRMANGLLSLGLERGERVAMLCENSVEAYLTKMAVAKAGLVVVPINTMMASDVIEHMLSFVEAKVAVVDANLWAGGGTAFIGAGVSPVVTIGPDGEGLGGVPSFHAFTQGFSPVEPDVRIHGDDIWEILLTSGTTAMPKAVMISHTYSYMAALSHAMAFTRNLSVETKFRMCTFLPIIYHVGDHAYVLSTFLAGGSTVLGRKPVGVNMAAAITRERPTALWGGSPQILGDFVRDVIARPGEFDLTSLEVIIYGWSAMSPDLAADLREVCGGAVEFVGIFGQTEAIACHRFWPNRWPDLHQRTAPQTNYVGVPAPLLAATVVNEVGESLCEQPGTAGEAVYRSPAMTSGYYRDEAGTREAFRDGWFHSGDMCEYGEEGLRVMVDRYKDVIKSGGENVSSIRVESVLVMHPNVSRAAVVGIADDHWGEAVTAVVVAAPGATINEAELIGFCRERLARYETPKRVVVLDELPVTVGGKVLKYRLRELLTPTVARE